MRKRDYIYRGAGIIVGLIFIYASYSKILYPHDFAKDIFYYQILPYNMNNLLALTLPWIELFAGVAIMAGPFRKGAAVSIILMLVVFIIAMISTMMRGINIECGCFTRADHEGGHTMSYVNIIRNVVLIVFSCLAYVQAKDKK